MIRTVTATRYVTPLREGGSLPAIVEADDDGLYVVKFRGAGQGSKALLAELVAGEIGRALGLPIPEIVFIELDSALGRSEPDFEIQALLKASVGLNLALDYLPGALPFDVQDVQRIDPQLASLIVWFDAYVTNVDRTARNTNMLFWHRRLMLIDHGASLYFHHLPVTYHERSRLPFTAIKDHVLLPAASALAEADQRAHTLLTADVLSQIVATIPTSWLGDAPAYTEQEEQRTAYLDYLLERLAHSAVFVEEAQRVRDQL